MAYIEIKGLTKWYPHKTDQLPRPGVPKKWVKALDDVDLSIEKGEVLGIIGESGCGKSTLGRLLTRLEEPTKGSVTIDGADAGAMLKKDPKQFRRQVQIVFQNPFDTFTPRDTIEKILMRPLKNHRIGKNDEERRQICLQGLEEGGLRPAEDIMSRYPHELSGGQLQRISIIRAMFLQPQFIVADEPVSMLDVSVRTEIIHMLQDISRSRDAAVAFISHDCASAKVALSITSSQRSLAATSAGSFFLNGMTVTGSPRTAILRFMNSERTWLSFVITSR